MDRTAVLAWVASYERAWREMDVTGLDRLFTPDAHYLRSPYDAEPLVGLAAIREFWADPTPFTMAAEPVAVDGAHAVVRVTVQYGGDEPQEYRDLFVLRFARDGRVEHFEEWPYWPDKPYTASAPEAAAATTPPVERSRTAAYALVRRGTDILLVRASDESGAPGRWFLPGGGIEFGEHPADAVVRELREETGLGGVVTSLVGVRSDVQTRPDGGERLHTLRVCYAVEVTGGDLVSEVAGSTDLARWVDADAALDLDLMPFVRAFLAPETPTT